MQNKICLYRYEIMLKCWSHLPEDRPSFKELSKCLWDLEHDGSTYVNVESLMRQSSDDQGTGNENQAEAQKDNNNIDDKPNAESELKLGITSNEGFDNPGFSLSEESLNASDEKRLLRKDKRSDPKTTLNKDEKVGNGVTSEMNSLNVE
ncbi:Hypothetical predicted protein [Paramuricea clavata]|uniref:Uncharacterized protein n=1 Tax=Paramuricea clavata TaxID=317549 RepID=A0A6S7KB38_PARCT|nr:Hypothetical predicted protein [Paramuricea clavata]